MSIDEAQRALLFSIAGTDDSPGVNVDAEYRPTVPFEVAENPRCPGTGAIISR